MEHIGPPDIIEDADHPPNPALLDLVPLEELQTLQDTLSKINALAMSITDPFGNPVTLPSNELAVCALVHRTTPGLEQCMENSRVAFNTLDASAPASCGPCTFLGVDRRAIPIAVDGIHLANLWVSQYTGHEPQDEQLEAYAARIGIDLQQLTSAIEQEEADCNGRLHRNLAWSGQLINQVVQVAYRNYMMTRRLKQIGGLEDELEVHRSRMEGLVEARTSELISANNRLQLEVLERELVEEQISRKSLVLDAINQVLQHTLIDMAEQDLFRVFLAKALQLTGSRLGFVAELQNEKWSVPAVISAGRHAESSEPIPEPSEAEVVRIWHLLLEKGGALSAGSDAHLHLRWGPLDQITPEIKSILLVPLSMAGTISGFVALAGNQREYARIDRSDVEALCQVVVESLLRKRSEAAKSQSERRLNIALESTNEGLWDFSPAEGRMFYSPRWFVMLGYLPDEFPETVETWLTLTHPDDADLLRSALDDLKACTHSEFNIEIRMLARSSQWHWIQVRGRTVSCAADGTAERIVGTLIDVSKYKQVEIALQKANDELQRLAALDDLTQIANRRRFDDRLVQEWRRALRDGTDLAVIICDIDHFKQYNDTYGHLKGDDALHAVAQAIHTALKRPMDLVARFGGEEFAMILPGTDIEGAERVAKEVKEAVAGLGIAHKSSDVAPVVTLSFGVAALTPTAALTPKILIETADRALYRAKAEGRDQIRCVSTGLSSENG